MPRDGAIIFRDLVGKLDVLNIEYEKCGRRAISDVKDKRTGSITIWGRIFFALTILSVIGGVYAQWTDNATEEKRNRETQSSMLNLLQRTERSVYDLSRLLQPIDKPRVTFFLKPNCDDPKFKSFCESARSLGRIQGRGFGKGTSFEVKNVDWSSYPGPLTKGVLYGLAIIYFFKEESAAESFLKRDEPNDGDGDMHLDLSVGNSDVTVEYRTGDEQIEFLASPGPVTPVIHNDKILSVVDIPGTTIIVTWPFDELILTAIFIETARGQTLHAYNLKASKLSGGRIYIYHFAQKS
jgi:hypothetical protein